MRCFWDKIVSCFFGDCYLPMFEILMENMTILVSNNLRNNKI